MFQSKEYVLEIYKTGSFSQAAANLYISQPSLSMIIKRLEEKIGEALFDRSVHPVKLTDCGQQYVATALKIKEAETGFLGCLDEYKNLVKGHIVIGGSSMNISFVLPPIISDFRKKYPHIKTEIIEGNIDALKRKLLCGEIDFMIDSCEMNPDIIEEYSYKKEHLLIAIPDNLMIEPEFNSYSLQYEDILNDRHLLSDVRPFPVDRLMDIPFIFLTAETDTYTRAMALCKYYSYIPNIIASFNQASTAYNIACSGMGAVFVSDTLVKKMIVKSPCNMHFFKILSEYGTRYIKFYSRKSRMPTYAMNAFLGSVFSNQIAF